MSASEAGGFAEGGRAIWQLIDTAPHNELFLAERQSTGDWLKVMRHSLYNEDQSVVHPGTGLLWCPLRWMPLFPPLSRAEARQIADATKEGSRP